MTQCPYSTDGRGWGEGSTFNSITVKQLQKPNDVAFPVARFRNKFGMTVNFILFLQLLGCD